MIMKHEAQPNNNPRLYKHKHKEWSNVNRSKNTTAPCVFERDVLKGITAGIMI